MRQATPGVLEEAPSGALIRMELEWMNRLSLQKCKMVWGPGEVEVAVPASGTQISGSLSQPLSSTLDTPTSC